MLALETPSIKHMENLLSHEVHANKNEKDKLAICLAAKTPVRDSALENESTLSHQSKSSIINKNYVKHDLRRVPCHSYYQPQRGDTEQHH